ncbi:MAG: aminodeoxychorismate synthase component I [Candidatus Hydrogenedentes bacterium]|nr:aminodeoxychorismate synthase component I [Candidatus Hydrogenedentota bacterium]
MGATGDIKFLSRARGLAFRNPREIIAATTLDQVAPALSRAQDAAARGAWVAGYVSYEAAPAFDPAMACHPPSTLPLVWFGVYEHPSEPRSERGAYSVGAWDAEWSENDYTARVRRIREYIAAGDTYQVNLTFPLCATFSGDAHAWFHDLCAAQAADHCAYIDTGVFQLACASPELFFELKNGVLRTRPMKGTRPRGRWPAEDEGFAEDLGASEKERAENLMIVDLLRSDMGRISNIGSVRTQSLFDVERYPTVWQMTSEIVSRSEHAVPEIFAALFPSGSVTGAPKIRTMQIIRKMETSPRGAYCGAMGWIAPGGDAHFNVAIRCATISGGTAEYAVGGGITWDSRADLEYAECLTKARVLTHRRPDFELLESILYEAEFFLLHEHLERLAQSARYFEFPLHIESARELLYATVRGRTGAPLKVRLLIDQSGNARAEAAPAPPSISVNLDFAAAPVQSGEVFLFHKTTHRQVYDEALASRPECDDVLLWNERGEVTESCTANVVVDLDGKLYTPPVSCGALAGTFRGALIQEGRITERILSKDDVRRARAVHLINSVRRWIPVNAERLRG